MRPILILSASLKPASRSRLLAQAAKATLEADGVPVATLDLRDLNLPLCDGGAAYGAPDVARATGLIRGAQGVLIASPIYNFDVNSALKNLIELTGQDAWEDQVVGLMCAAGGGLSYMAPLSFANSLMLDFRCVVVPRFVFASGADFGESAIANPKIAERVATLARETTRVARALR